MKSKLVPLDGFLYAIKYEGIKSKTWICTERGKNASCLATIEQYGDNRFVSGPHRHNHQGTVRIIEKKTDLSSKVEASASISKSSSAMSIVEASILDSNIDNQCTKSKSSC